ncbi:hypothetical protein [Geomesophilobacter sediminis]|uniref:NERD domain-containing protein n=1 Tax=Geomesophilobacter sediminis TaxID=2798584 RepID=A0A8J7M2H5_9BACT|nr:hypothetical protein [Geomesophilobacter sediminis]MBJ6727186.1 hypothetical protein [Geomesophilobacter sediminis]
MNFIEYINGYKHEFWWQDIAEETLKITKGCLDAKDRRHILAEIKKSIKEKNVKSLTNWLTVGLYLDDEEVIVEIRKKGLIRKSKYDFERSTLHKAVASIIEKQELLSLAPNTVQYLNSVSVLYVLSLKVFSIYISIKDYIAKAKPSLLKTLLCSVDFSFFCNHQPNSETSSEVIQYYSSEDISEAISYLVYLFKAKHGIGAANSKNIDEELILTPEFTKLIIDACKIKEYMKYEILLDYFGYTFSKIDNRKFLISDPSEKLEKSIRLGFIRTEIQRFNTVAKWFEESKKSESLVAAAIDIYEKSLGKFYVVKTDPIERLVFQLPSVEPFKKLAETEGLFQEEILLLADLYSELFVSFKELDEFVINGTLTLRDILKVKRIFTFITGSFNAFLQSKYENDKLLVLRSLLPVMSKETLNKTLEACLDADKMNSWIEVMSWAGEEGKILDLQYTPLIPVVNHYFVLMNVLDSANIIRNVLSSQQKRIFHEGTIDPLSQLLKEELVANGFDVKTDVKFKYHGHESDIDVLALKDGIVFVFECKNSMLPGNISEIRTSFDYIRKAGKQLGDIDMLESKGGFFKYLFDKIGWFLPPFFTYSQCIITGNRAFYGYCYGKFRVIPVREMHNFLAEGTVVFKDKDVRIRPTGPVTGPILADFIDNNIIHKMTYEATEAVYKNVRFHNANVIAHSFALNFNKLEELHSEFQELHKNDFQ